MSYQLKISDRKRQSGRFVARVHREIQKAFSVASQNGLTQQKLATKLEMDRSAVNKKLLGQSNLTLRTLSDLAWGMDYQIKLNFIPNGRMSPTPSNFVRGSTSSSQDNLIIAGSNFASPKTTATSLFTTVE